MVSIDDFDFSSGTLACLLGIWLAANMYLIYLIIPKKHNPLVLQSSLKVAFKTGREAGGADHPIPGLKAKKANDTTRIQTPPAKPPSSDTIQVSRSLQSETQSITIKNTIPLPNPCYSLKPRVSLSNSTITVAIVAYQEMRVTCSSVLSNETYQVSLSNLDPDTYTLIVEHRYPLIGWETQRHSFHSIRIGD